MLQEIKKDIVRVNERKCLTKSQQNKTETIFVSEHWEKFEQFNDIFICSNKSWRSVI